MLRTRLLLGLLTVVFLLWAVGGTGFVILKDASSRFDSRVNQDYRLIKAAQGIRSGASALNSHYLPRFLPGATAVATDRTVFNRVSSEFDSRLKEARSAAEGNSRLTQQIEDLEIVLGSYLKLYNQAIASPPAAPELAYSFQTMILQLSQRTTDLVDGISSIGEERMFTGSGTLVRESRMNLLLIGTLVFLGTIMSALIYHQLFHYLVEPVEGLRDALEKVKEGDFHTQLALPRRGSEFKALASSFNEMAAELSIRRSETDLRLRRKNITNRALLSTIPSPVYMLIEDHPPAVLNPAAEELNKQLGCTDPLPAKINKLYEECVKTGRNLRPEDPREALLFRVEEEERFFLPRIFRFSSENDEYAGWAILLHDVTRIRWLDDMKSNLLATVSHEIKTPLTGIQMALLLLGEEQTGTLTPTQKTMVNSANKDCGRLLSTLKDLLDLSRAESGTTRLDLEHTNLAVIAQGSVDLFHPKAAGRGVRLYFEESSETIPLVMADEPRIREVVNNLVSNAVKHCPAGGEVRLRLRPEGTRFVRFSVFDDGPGVPAEEQARVFERFYKARGNLHEGVGLGLFISREIIRAHEGRIGVRDATPGTPTEFYIDVPIAPPA